MGNPAIYNMYRVAEVLHCTLEEMCDKVTLPAFIAWVKYLNKKEGKK